MKKDVDIRTWLMVAGVLVLLLSGPRVDAAAVPLAWDPPTENEDGSPVTDLAGYKLYFGLATRTYTNCVDLGNVSSVTITGLDPRVTYYFAITAYDSTRAESSFSDELTWNSDADADGLPDAWERTFFGGTSVPEGGPSDDYDHDGYLNYQEFIAGTSPTDPLDHAVVECTRGDGRPVLSFSALQATGLAYDGYRRFYALERRPAALTSAWSPVPQFDAILGANQLVVYTAPAEENGCWYRTRSWLQ